MKKIVLFIAIALLFLAVDKASAQVPNKQIPAAQYYVGGQEAMYKLINDNKNYPVNAKRNRIQGECIVHIFIEEDGKISSAQVVKNIGGGCGEESMRLIKMLKFKPPGFRVSTDIPVIFSL